MTRFKKTKNEDLRMPGWWCGCVSTEAAPGRDLKLMGWQVVCVFGPHKCPWSTQPLPEPGLGGGSS